MPKKHLSILEYLKKLEEVPKAPITRRIWTVTPEEEVRVSKIRNFSKCKWGKEKIKARYFKVYGREISTNKIQKVINKLNLYADTKEHILRLKRNHSWDISGILIQS